MDLNENYLPLFKDSFIENEKLFEAIINDFDNVPVDLIETEDFEFEPDERKLWRYLLWSIRKLSPSSLKEIITALGKNPKDMSNREMRDFVMYKFKNLSYEKKKKILKNPQARDILASMNRRHNLKKAAVAGQAISGATAGMGGIGLLASIGNPYAAASSFAYLLAMGLLYLIPTSIVRGSSNARINNYGTRIWQDAKNDIINVLKEKDND